MRAAEKLLLALAMLVPLTAYVAGYRSGEEAGRWLSEPPDGYLSKELTSWAGWCLAEPAWSGLEDEFERVRLSASIDQLAEFKQTYGECQFYAQMGRVLKIRR